MTAAKFWVHADRSGGEHSCWTWLAYRHKSGYGQTSIGGRNTPAHRAAWIFAHLFLGTPADNAADMVSKGRQATGDSNGMRLRPEKIPRGDEHWARRRPDLINSPKGEAQGGAKLTERIVRDIRKRVEGGESQTSVAKRYGVHQCTVSFVVRRLHWAHVQ